MECYEGATMIKTYRGLLADGGQDKINLKTNRGEIGYRIVKFQIMPPAIGTTAAEYCVKIFKLSQGTIDAVVDFTDGDLLAVATMKSQTTLGNPETPMQIIFDQEIFNQDIYITGFDADSSNSINYYLELEQVPLNDNESTMATLQSLRQIAEK